MRLWLILLLSVLCGCSRNELMEVHNQCRVDETSLQIFAGIPTFYSGRDVRAGELDSSKLWKVECKINQPCRAAVVDIDDIEQHRAVHSDSDLKAVQWWAVGLMEDVTWDIPKGPATKHVVRLGKTESFTIDTSSNTLAYEKTFGDKAGVDGPDRTGRVSCTPEGTRVSLPTSSSLRRRMNRDFFWPIFLLLLAIGSLFYGSVGLRGLTRNRPILISSRWNQSFRYFAFAIGPTYSTTMLDMTHDVIHTRVRSSDSALAEVGLSAVK